MMVYRKQPVEVVEQSATLSKIRTEDGNEFTVKTTSLKPLTKPRTPRSLRVMTKSEEIQKFIDYLRTPAANTKLHLEAQVEEMDFAVREQYRKMTGGEELVEGFGYHVAPFSAGKTGCEGVVTFAPPINIPAEIKDLMVQRPGLINRISFVWLLVEEGFRASR